MNEIKNKKTNGFTIVELLIVVVVIGILAAITIVAFNGIQNRAAAASLQSDLRNAGMKLETLREQTGTGYPVNTDALRASAGTIFQYTQTPADNYYCLTALSSRASVPSYFINSTSKTVTQGLCPGHGPVTSGFSWTERTSLGTKLWRDIAISSNGLVIAAASNYDYMYLSTDGGATWTPNMSLGTRDSWSELSMTADGATIVAIGDGALHVSTNTGSTWVERSKPAGVLTWSKATISSNGTRIGALGVIDEDSFETRIFTSSNTGSTWTQRSASGLIIGADIAASPDGMRLVVSDGATWIPNSGHVYTSTDYGATWTERTGTGGGSVSYGVAISTDGSKLFVGGHYGPLWTSTNSGTTWQSIDEGYSLESVSASGDGTRVIAGGNTVVHSTNTGATWTVVSHFPNPPSGGGQRVALSQDGSRYVVAGWGTHLYTGTYTP